MMKKLSTLKYIQNVMHSEPRKQILNIKKDVLK